MANEEVRERNVEHVMMTAFECFKEYGIEKTTINMVAIKSDISLRSINRYFSNKADLVISAFEWFGRYVEGKYKFDIEKLKTSTKSGAELLTDFFSYIRKTFAEVPRIYSMQNEFNLYACRSELAKTEKFEKARYSISARLPLKMILERGLSDGTLNVPYSIQHEVEFINHALLSFLGDLAISNLLESTPCEENTKNMLDIMFDQLLNTYMVK